MKKAMVAMVAMVAAVVAMAVAMVVILVTVPKTYTARVIDYSDAGLVLVTDEGEKVYVSPLDKEELQEIFFKSWETCESWVEGKGFYNTEVYMTFVETDVRYFEELTYVKLLK